MYSKTHSNSSIVFFSLVTVFLLSVGLTEDAFAGTLQPDNYPSVPDALVNYDSTTDKSTITWDFDDLPNYTGGLEDGNPARCAIKADFGFSSDPEFDPPVKINGFMAREYSPTYDPSGFNVAGALQSTDNVDTDIQGEEIPCTGELIIDFDAIIGNTYFHDDPDWAPLDYNQVGHENNTATHVGVEPFISFYIMNNNGDFQTGEHTVIDEVFILYHPDSVISDATIEWACGFYDTDADNQVAVGNVLFIDQNGISGTGGPDNCDTVVELDESEFCCDFTISISSSSSRGCDDCFDSTFYYSQHKIIVKDGFSYNEYSTDVTDTHTETPPLFTDINRPNIMKLKVYDNFGTDAIKWIDVGFGLAKIKTSLDTAEVLIEIRLLDNVVKEYKISDPHNLVDFGDITSNVVDCGYVEENCLQVTIPHSFNDKLINDIIGVKASDYEPNKKIHYFNEGIHIEGTPDMPLTDKIFVQKYLGNPDFEWVDIVRVDRSDDIWASEDGLEFTSSHGGGYLRITPMGIDPNLK